MTDFTQILRTASDAISFLHRNATEVDFKNLSAEQNDELKTLLQNIVSLLEFLSEHEKDINK
jgi:hypothetical protein